MGAFCSWSKRADDLGTDLGDGQAPRADVEAELADQNAFDRFRVRLDPASRSALGRSIVRLAGLVLSIASLFIGFVPVLFDQRRRGLADFLAGTVVLYDDEPRH